MSLWRRHGTVVVVEVDADSGADAATAVADGALPRPSPSQPRAGPARSLSLVEAYLALALDHSLALPTAPAMSLEEIWADFSRASPTFVAQVVVSMHFRSCGWTLRSGLNYGVHFVLYRGAVDAFHSEYMLYVLDQTAPASASPGMTWSALQALTRIAEDVKKTVVLCSVRCGDDSSDDREELATMALVDGNESTTGPSETPELRLTGRHHFHGVDYVVEAVLIRYWDPTTVDEDRPSYAFPPQPIVPKAPRRAPKKNKRKLQVHVEGCDGEL